MALRNIDYSDREMLLVIQQVLTDQGIAFSLDVADALDVKPLNGRSPAGRVSSRLAWMARLGQLERLDPRDYGRLKKEACWRITELGDRLLRGRLTVAAARVIESGDVGSHILMMRALSNRAFVRADESSASALRREWQYNAAQRGGGR